MTVPHPAHSGQRPRWVRGAIVASVLGVAIVVAAVVAGIAGRQHIADQLTVWNNPPTATIRAYEARTTMTEAARFVFEASRPSIEPESAFNTECGANVEGSGVLGCYLPASKRILLYDVTDDRLDGLEETVAAHEMLHAAWDRMSAGERAELAKPLEDQATSLAADPQFTSLMSSYAKAEPGERLNELHSIIGTQVADLSPALERHYATYFADRAAVVALYTTAHGVLDATAERAATLASQLTALTATIDAEYSRYTAGYSDLNDDIEAFNKRATSGTISSQKQFDRQRKALVTRRDELDALYATIQADKATWDSTRAELESVNADADELNASINVPPASGADLD